jgi:hypothetical protein
MGKIKVGDRVVFDYGLIPPNMNTEKSYECIYADREEVGFDMPKGHKITLTQIQEAKNGDYFVGPDPILAAALQVLYNKNHGCWFMPEDRVEYDIIEIISLTDNSEDSEDRGGLKYL